MYIKPNQPFVLPGLILHKNPNGSSYEALKKERKRICGEKKARRQHVRVLLQYVRMGIEYTQRRRRRRRIHLGIKSHVKFARLFPRSYSFCTVHRHTMAHVSNSPDRPGPRASSPSMRASTMRCMMMHMPSVVVLNPCFRLRLRRPLYIRGPRSHRHFFHVQYHLVHFAARREVTRVHGFILRDPSQRTACRS